nr:small nuclear ribonucleoprotein SM D2 [Cryptomonas sp.]
MDSPLSLLSEAIALNRPIIVFSRNNKKLYGHVRAFDRHMNLALENIRELSSTHDKKKGLIYHERYISKMILRGDSIILFLPI